MRLYNLFRNLITKANIYTDSKFKIVSGTGIKTSAVASVERCTWVQVGKIVQVAGTFTTASSGVGATTTFFTGLPQPAMFARFTATRVYDQTAFRLAIELDGSIVNGYSGGSLTDREIEFGFTYIAKDFAS